MTNACIITPWAGNGLTTETAYHPALADAYTLLSWADAVSQPPANIPPTNNLFAINVQLADATAATLFADSNWKNAILWMDTLMPATTAQTSAQFTAISNILAGSVVLPANIVRPAVTITPNPIGTGPNGKTNQQIAALAIAYLKTLTK